MNTHRSGEGPFVESIFIHERNEIWNEDDDCGNTSLNEDLVDMVVAVDGFVASLFFSCTMV